MLQKKNIVFGRKLHEPKKRGFGVARFFDLPTIRLAMVGTGTDGRAYQLQCAILAVQPGLYTLGVEKPDAWRSCRRLEPLSAHGRPEADP